MSDESAAGGAPSSRGHDLKLLMLQRRTELQLRQVSEQAHELKTQLAAVTERAARERQELTARTEATERESRVLREATAAREAEFSRVKSRLDEYVSASSSAVRRTEHVSAVTAEEFELRMLALEAAGREAVRDTEVRMHGSTRGLREELAQAHERIEGLKKLVDGAKAITDKAKAEWEERAAKQRTEIKTLRERIRGSDDERRRKEAEADHGRRKLSEKEMRERERLEASAKHAREHASELKVQLDQMKLHMTHMRAEAEEQTSQLAASKAQLVDVSRSSERTGSKLRRASIEQRILSDAIATADADWEAHASSLVAQLRRAEAKLHLGTAGVRAELEEELAIARKQKQQAVTKLVGEIDALRVSTSRTRQEIVRRARAVEEVWALALARMRLWACASARARACVCTRTWARASVCVRARSCLLAACLPCARMGWLQMLRTIPPHAHARS
jgi:hypothetical protein